MAKKIYIGVTQTNTSSSSTNLFPLTWTDVSPSDAPGTSYIAADGSGIKLTANGYKWTKPDVIFDNKVDEFWCGPDGKPEDWVCIQFPSSKRITSMKTYIQCSDTVYIQGSNNGTSWTTLYTITEKQTALTTITLSNSTAYTYYRVYINSTQSNLIIYELQGFTTESTTVYKQVARNVKNAYIGVSDKARKLKKGYIGVGGVAKCFYSKDPVLEYYGTIENMDDTYDPGTSGDYRTPGATAGNYAVFVNGYWSPCTTTAYSSSLVKSNPDNHQSAYCLGSGSIGSYALFVGGKRSSSGYKDVVAYNSSLVKKTPSELLTLMAINAASANTSSYVLFASAGSTGNTGYDDVTAYNSSLVRTVPAVLSKARTDLAGSKAGTYALFAGGQSGSTTQYVVDVYSSSLVLGTPLSLSKSRAKLMGAYVNNYALFAGGGSNTIVDVFDSSLTKTTATSLNMSKQSGASVSLTHFAVFAGGFQSSSSKSSYVNYYSKDLTRTIATSLSVARAFLGGAKAGDYAIFAGGDKDGTAEAYKQIV